MKRLLSIRKIASCLLICSMVLPCAGQTGNSWDKVRYNGGSVSADVSPGDWGNRLTVSSESIKLFLKDRQTISIKPSNVTGLSYGQEAHRRVGTMVALGILVAPVALFGLFHKTKLHYIAIEYNTDDGKKAGMLLQGHKDNYRAILQALKSVSGKEIQTAPNERLNLIADSQAQRPPESSQSAVLPKPGVEPERTLAKSGRITISSPITGSEVDLDGLYIGGTPTTIDIPEGTHTITVKNGTEIWQRELQVIPGSMITVEATFPNAKLTDPLQPASNKEQAGPNKTIASCTESMKSVPLSSSTSGIKQLECGQEITVLSQDRNWTHIRTTDGKEGYIPTRFVGKTN